VGNFQEGESHPSLHISDATKVRESFVLCNFISVNVTIQYNATETYRAPYVTKQIKDSDAND